MKTTHTPGPWSYNQSKARKWYVYGADKWPIFVTNVSATHRPKDETEANNRLIAAAPELLKACQLALNFINTEKEIVGYGHATADLLQAAIAKAEGQQ